MKKNVLRMGSLAEREVLSSNPLQLIFQWLMNYMNCGGRCLENPGPVLVVSNRCNGRGGFAACGPRFQALNVGEGIEYAPGLSGMIPPLRRC